LKILTIFKNCLFYGLANKILYAFPDNTGYGILEINNWQQKCSSNAAPRSGFALRPLECSTNGEHAGEPSPLAAKIGV